MDEEWPTDRQTDRPTEIPVQLTRNTIPTFYYGWAGGGGRGGGVGSLYANTNGMIGGDK